MLLTLERHIAHLDLDTFFVSVECLRNSKLVGKPVLIGGTGDRGVVASCSYEARKFGIHSAMPMKIARRLCSHAIIIRGDMEMYSKYSRLVTDIVRDTVPLFEKSSIDEFYVDLTGMEKFFGCKKFTDELKRKVLKESGLPISYGLSSRLLFLDELLFRLSASIFLGLLTKPLFKNKIYIHTYLRLAIKVRYIKQVFLFLRVSLLSHPSLWQEIQKPVLHFQ